MDWKLPVIDQDIIDCGGHSLILNSRFFFFLSRLMLLQPRFLPDSEGRCYSFGASYNGRSVSYFFFFTFFTCKYNLGSDLVTALLVPPLPLSLTLRLQYQSLLAPRATISLVIFRFHVLFFFIFTPQIAMVCSLQWEVTR
jgi:hypothetical protein